MSPVAQNYVRPNQGKKEPANYSAAQLLMIQSQLKDEYSNEEEEEDGDYDD